MHFEDYAVKGNEFLNSLAFELGGKNYKESAARLTRCVFRVLRNCLTPEESLELLAQLPMALKAVYVDGWQLPKRNAHPRREEDFISLVMKEDGLAAYRDFSNEADARQSVKIFFGVLGNYVSGGQMREMIGVLPSGIRSLLEDDAVSNRINSLNL